MSLFKTILMILAVVFFLAVHSLGVAIASAISLFFAILMNSYKERKSSIKLFLFKDIALAVFVGYCSNFLYNRVYPSDQKAIYNMLAEGLIKMDQISAEINKNSKVDVELENLYRNIQNKETVNYLKMVLREGDDLSSYTKWEIKDKYFSNDYLPLQLEGLYLLSFSEDSLMYKEKFIDLFISYVHSSIIEDVFPYENGTIIFDIFQDKTFLNKEEILKITKKTSDYLVNEFSNYEIKNSFLQMIMNSNYFLKTNLKQKDFISYTKIIRANNDLLLDDKFGTLSSLVNFCPQQFISVMNVKLYEGICHKISIGENLENFAYFSEKLKNANIKGNDEYKQILESTNFMNSPFIQELDMDSFLLNYMLGIVCDELKIVQDNCSYDIDLWLDNKFLSDTSNYSSLKARINSLTL